MIASGADTARLPQSLHVAIQGRPEVCGCSLRCRLDGIAATAPALTRQLEIVHYTATAHPKCKCTAVESRTSLRIQNQILCLPVLFLGQQEK